jgi:hypothetical protein
VELPMKQFARREMSLGVLVRVTPKLGGGPALLLKDSGALPKPDEEAGDTSKFQAQLQGYFYLGEGAYHAELVVSDGERRVCRKQWDLELKPHKVEGAALAPGRLAALSQLEWSPREAGAGSATVFLHAGPPRGNGVLLASLAAVLNRMAFRRVEVVVFNLGQHKEVLRTELGDADGFARVARALDEANPSTVSYQVLQDPTGHRDFLWQLLAKETLRAEPPDVVLFMGYPTLDDSHVITPPACADGTRKTQYAYLDFAQPGGRTLRFAGPERRRRRGPPDTGLRPPSQAMPEMPDAISRVARACSGKVYPIHSPDDLAAALRKLEERLPQ